MDAVDSRRILEESGFLPGLSPRSNTIAKRALFYLIAARVIDEGALALCVPGCGQKTAYEIVRRVRVCMAEHETYHAGTRE